MLDTDAFEWTRRTTAGRVPLEELVIYELHVGTFTAEGTFDAAAARLPELAELGVTAVELMPVATFPGERGWGYDGVLTYAPHRAYGGPHGLARFVDAAHAAGLAVILDVVYNHIGPGSEMRRRVRPVLHRPLRHLLGRRRSTTRSAACASGRSRTPSTGSATTASTGCGSTPSHAIFDESADARPRRARRARPRASTADGS